MFAATLTSILKITLATSLDDKNLEQHDQKVQINNYDEIELTQTSHKSKQMAKLKK